MSLVTGLNLTKRVFISEGFHLDFLNATPETPFAFDYTSKVVYQAIPFGIKFYFPIGKCSILVNPCINAELELSNKTIITSYFEDGHTTTDAATQNETYFANRIFLHLK